MEELINSIEQLTKICIEINKNMIEIAKEQNKLQLEILTLLKWKL